MMQLEEKLQTLISDYEPISDPQERMSLVVDSAPKSMLLPSERRTEALRVPACISAAWIEGRLENGLCQFSCAADSPLVQGLIACLCSFFSGATPNEVATSVLDPLSSLGLSKNLSPTRQNGLSSARKRILSLAQSLVEKK